MAFDSLKDACEKLRVDYHRFFHVGRGGSLPQNVAIQFNLNSHHTHDEHGNFVDLDFPEDILYLVKYFEAEDIFLVWRRYELGNTHNPSVSITKVETALKDQEKVHIVDHRQGTAYGPQSPVFVFQAEYAEDFLNQIVVPELPLVGISGIRILPMEKSNFKSKDDVDDFILHDLSQNGLYFCHKTIVLNNSYDRLFVLFQYDGCLVGCGETVYQKPDKYSGCYEFDTDTVRLFDNPITAGEFLPLVDNAINGFSQAVHKIDLQYLEHIVSYINLNCSESDDTEITIIEAVESGSKTGLEGKKILYHETRYERDPKLRKAAIDACRQKYGALICEVCKTNYDERHGEFGCSVIEVHHIKPLGQVGCEHDVNPETDMVCLCANCHKMMHYAIRKYGHLLTAAELREIVF